MKTMINTLKLILSIFLGCLALPVNALSDGLYQVEVVCFENLNTVKEQHEEWPVYVGSLDTKKAIRLNSDSEVIKSVLASGRVLNHDIKIIQESPNHRFILANGWRQPLKEQVRSTPIYFTGGHELNNHKSEIEGVVSVKLIKNLFHVNLDIIFRKLEHGKIKEVRLTQVARLKAKESYYFDHELFGAFVIVTPIA